MGLSGPVRMNLWSSSLENDWWAHGQHVYSTCFHDGKSHWVRTITRFYGGCRLKTRVRIQVLFLSSWGDSKRVLGINAQTLAKASTTLTPTTSQPHFEFRLCSLCSSHTGHLWASHSCNRSPNTGPLYLLSSWNERLFPPFTWLTSCFVSSEAPSLPSQMLYFPLTSSQSTMDLSQNFTWSRSASICLRDYWTNNNDSNLFHFRYFIQFFRVSRPSLLI